MVDQSVPDKPAELFDREAEWSDLASFAVDPSPGASLALVYGRRRQGKTLLLELLAERLGGFFVTGLEQSSAQNLAAVSGQYAAHLDLRAPVTFSDWEQVFSALLALGEGSRPVPVVVDELPYLLRGAPEIPSVIQRVLSPRGRARQHSRARLIVCGSAFSVMRDLLGGTAPLRGRATREVVLRPFDYRDAAAFWGVADDPELAVRLHALCGGTPAYRDFAGGDVPGSAKELDGWVVRHLLNPASAFFREGRVLLAEEPQATDMSLYFAVLAAIAAGRTRRGQIADAVGRKETALAHPLTVLQDAELVRRRRDPLRANRATFHIAEPMLRFHQLVVTPHEPRLLRRAGDRVWEDIAATVSSRIYGPHFEHLAAEWTSAHDVGAGASHVAASAIDCPHHHSTHEIDVLAVGQGSGHASQVLAIGEAKWRSAPLRTAELDRLRHIRDLLRAPEATLLLFGRGGFDRELAAEVSASRDVELVDLERLYAG